MDETATERMTFAVWKWCMMRRFWAALYRLTPKRVLGEVMNEAWQACVEQDTSYEQDLPCYRLYHWLVDGEMVYHDDED